MKNKLAIFTHAVHREHKGNLYAYAPYVREMDLWTSNFEQVSIVAPFSAERPGNLEKAYQHQEIYLKAIREFHFKNVSQFFYNIFGTIQALQKISKEMRAADHVHIRCPGNVGLLACFVQIFFPSKKKTIKYAGNWDPNGKGQPWSYKLQKWLISQPWLTKNAKVLVYGKWQNQSKNIVPFFTASYSKNEIKKIEKVFQPPFRFIFVGSLVSGKRPLLAIKIVQALYEKGVLVQLDVYGDGILRKDLENFVRENSLDKIINFHGNITSDLIKKVFLRAHFSILPSRSEGWPKALAEAMFFGCIAVSTPVSCVPWMLGNGNRGILINPELESATAKIIENLNDLAHLSEMSEKALTWAQQYTTERFRAEIRKLV